MQITIKQLLSLETRSVESFAETNYIEFEPFSEMGFDFFYEISYQTYKLSDEYKNRLRVEDKTFDQCNDCRSRDTKIFYFDDKPFMMYQYVGEGYYQNMKVFNNIIFKNFLNASINEYEHNILNTGYEIINDGTPIELNLYGGVGEIVDNRLWCKLI